MKVSRKHIISIALSEFLTLIPVLSFATSSDNNQRNNYNEAALYEAIEPVINAYECFILGIHTARKVCSGC